MGCYRNMMMVVVALSMVLMTTVQAQKLSDYPCIQSLIPCNPALNTTGTPPQSCCGPLKTAFQTQLSCLCAVFQNTELHKDVGVNITEAMAIPARCGIADVQDSCAAVSPAPAPVAGGPTSALGPASGVPPAFGPAAGGPSAGVASTPTATAGNSGGNSVTWAGSVSGLMLLLAGLMFY